MPLRSLINGILLSVLASGPAFAQRPRVAADSTKTATVRRLLQLTKTGEAIVTGMEAAVPAQRRAYPDVPDEVWDAFLARARQKLPQIVDSLVPVYATRFSQAELNELIKFFTSPVGHHLSDAQPEMLRESLEIGGRWGEVIGREIQDSLARSGGPSADFALQSRMKSDLRNLITAEEAFFADSVKYTTTIGVGGVDYHLSPDNKIVEMRLTPDGWVATMGNAKTRTICAIFVGSTPIAPAVEEGRPACQVRPM
jgi:hypothetical protein